ncbi:unnamed protein product [Periconia digitata]|uniref:Uncharacterized protein n=1 Tax=Periconia digitata TaxID=1303443 RepID=A0A9W4XVM6_9PLEO|nr:unnamed protein product [Periconia digitata]
MATTTIMMETPFAILPEDMHRLEQEEGFVMLRGYLKDMVGADFCTTHTAAPQTHATSLLQRDILHALNMPLAALFHRASALAAAALCSKTASDHELAFTGPARSAFLWLQCFLAEEEAWVRTAGCPACIVTATLSTESHIRLTIAAALLSTSPPPPPSPTIPEADTALPCADGVEAGREKAAPQLPSLPHIIPALRAAIEADAFWGPDYWDHLFSRATQLCASFRALMAGMADLETLVESPSPTCAAGERGVGVGVAQPGARLGVAVRESRLAKRQLRLEREEVELARRWSKQCWGKALGIGVALVDGVRDRDGRVRRLTCP